MQGTLSITARVRDTGEAWYARIGIPAAVATAVGFTPGMQIATKLCGNIITLTADHLGRARFPAASGKARRHCFEQSARILRLPLKTLHETATDVFADLRDGYGQIRLIVPHLAAATTPEPVDFRGIPGLYGTAKTLTIEALRYGKEVRHLTLVEIIELLREHGRRVVMQGPRAFKLDGQSACVADLLEAAVRVSGDRSIALIME